MASPIESAWQVLPPLPSLFRSSSYIILHSSIDSLFLHFNSHSFLLVRFCKANANILIDSSLYMGCPTMCNANFWIYKTIFLFNQFFISLKFLLLSAFCFESLIRSLFSMLYRSISDQIGLSSA
jgi:hypothetical protein